MASTEEAKAIGKIAKILEEFDRRARKRIVDLFVAQLADEDSEAPGA